MNLRRAGGVTVTDVEEGNAQLIRFVLMAAGVLVAIAGTVFALQGFGVLGGSEMSGSHFWAAAGPVIAVAGLVLLALGARRRPARPR
jgi:hypothetical protein